MVRCRLWSCFAAVCARDRHPVRRRARHRAAGGIAEATSRYSAGTADDRVFALVDRCPHKGGPLSQGIVHGERVACPLHGLEYRACERLGRRAGRRTARAIDSRASSRRMCCVALPEQSMAETRNDVLLLRRRLRRRHRARRR